MDEEPEIPQIPADSPAKDKGGEVRSDIPGRQQRLEDLMHIVVVILIVMVGTLIVDSFHFNSATYKEYSEKMNTLGSLQETNRLLLEENKINQETIIELLKDKSE